MNVTTRSEALKIEYSDHYPSILPDGRRKTFEEVFIPPSGNSTRRGAEKHLNDIHGEHPTSLGWVCFEGHSGFFEEKDQYFPWAHYAKYA